MPPVASKSVIRTNLDFLETEELFTLSFVELRVDVGDGFFKPVIIRLVFFFSVTSKGERKAARRVLGSTGYACVDNVSKASYLGMITCSMAFTLRLVILMASSNMMKDVCKDARFSRSSMA